MGVFTLTIIQLHVNGIIHLMNQRATEIIIPQYSLQQSKKNVKTMTTVASQINVHEVINFPLKLFRKFISPRGLPHLAAVHERVKKNRRVLTLQVDDHCIINILLKDIQLKTNLRNHVFIKQFSSMRVFTLAIIQLHVNANIHLMNHAFLRYLPDRDPKGLSD